MTSSADLGEIEGKSLVAGAGEANGGLRFEYGGVWKWISTVAGIPVMWEGADVVDN